MGKITSIYLTDEEATQLKKFCEENQCTQYSALKTALKELLSGNPRQLDEPSKIDQSILNDEQDSKNKETVKHAPRRQMSLTKLLNALKEMNHK